MSLVKLVPPYAIPLLGTYAPSEPFLLTLRTLGGVGIPLGRSMSDAQINEVQDLLYPNLRQKKDEDPPRTSRIFTVLKAYCTSRTVFSCFS